MLLSHDIPARKYDALKKLINTLLFTIKNFEEDEKLKKAPGETKARLRNHLEQAGRALGSKGNDHHS